MTEFQGEEDTEYLLAIENHYSTGDKITEYEVGNWQPIFTNDQWHNLEGWCLMDSNYEYKAPLWATGIRNNIRTVTHFAVIGSPTP